MPMSRQLRLLLLALHYCFSNSTIYVFPIIGVPACYYKSYGKHFRSSTIRSQKDHCPLNKPKHAGPQEKKKSARVTRDLQPSAFAWYNSSTIQSSRFATVLIPSTSTGTKEEKKKSSPIQAGPFRPWPILTGFGGGGGHFLSSARNNHIYCYIPARTARKWTRAPASTCTRSRSRCRGPASIIGSSDSATGAYSSTSCSASTSVFPAAAAATWAEGPRRWPPAARMPRATVPAVSCPCDWRVRLPGVGSMVQRGRCSGLH